MYHSNIICKSYLDPDSSWQIAQKTKSKNQTKIIYDICGIVVNLIPVWIFNIEELFKL